MCFKIWNALKFSVKKKLNKQWQRFNARIEENKKRKQRMNTRGGLCVYGYVRQNFEQKCLIHGIITTIIQFFKNKGGFLYVCGSGEDGKLGIKEFYGKECTEPTLVPSVNEIIDIAARLYHTMLVNDEGSLWAFGNGYCGRLGSGNEEDVKVPQQISLNRRAISVSVGNEHSMILADDGAVLSCGKNDRGQLGHGDTKSQFVPKVIEALKEHKITQISSGCYHNGALNKNGDLFMWGWNYYGQCGVGKEKGDKIYTPQMIKLNEKVSMIECGYHHSLLITMNDFFYSFGLGDNYQLGHGTNEKKYVPTLVEALKHVNVVNLAGGRYHTLCIDDEFNVWSFGRNCEGQCAQPKNIEYQRTPKKIEHFAKNKIKAKHVAAGAHSSCVITQNNECFVFGDNYKYQIGLKEKKGYFVPNKLPLFVQKVSMGTNYSTFISNNKKE